MKHVFKIIFSLTYVLTIYSSESTFNQAEGINYKGKIYQPLRTDTEALVFQNTPLGQRTLLAYYNFMHGDLKELRDILYHSHQYAKPTSTSEYEQTQAWKLFHEGDFEFCDHGAIITWNSDDGGYRPIMHPGNNNERLFIPSPSRKNA